MKIIILGTGMVGQTLATRLSLLGHEITLGTRNTELLVMRETPNPMTGLSFVDWYRENSDVKLMKFGDSVSKADLIVSATQGSASIEALQQIGEDQLKGKIILDIANPLDFSKGMPPTLLFCNDTSLGEKIQERFPESKVVKSLNTMSASLMVNPGSLKGKHNVFMSGNDVQAKKMVADLLKAMGWEQNNIIDLGDISTARATEMLLPVWLRLWNNLGHVNFNFHIQDS